MTEETLIKGKRILIVDDEPDILATLEELLSLCDVVKAGSFEEAREMLETQYFDMAILDIMGVDGFKLLDIAIQKKVLAIMLTAHALSPETTAESYKKGAAFYVPKEEIGKIEIFLEDVFKADKEGKKYWGTWLDRLGDYYNKKFGDTWKYTDDDFWEEIKK